MVTGLQVASRCTERAELWRGHGEDVANRWSVKASRLGGVEERSGAAEVRDITEEGMTTRPRRRQCFKSAGVDGRQWLLPRAC